MNYIEITFDDGTIARWAIADPDPDAFDSITNYIEMLVGPATTIIC